MMARFTTHGCDISTQLHLLGGFHTPSDVAVFARTTVSPVCDIARAICFCHFATFLLHVVSTAETLLAPFTRPIMLLCWLCGVPGKDIEHQIHFFTIGFATIGLMVCITQGLGRFGKEFKVYKNLNAFKKISFLEGVDKIAEGAYLDRKIAFILFLLELSCVLLHFLILLELSWVVLLHFLMALLNSFFVVAATLLLLKSNSNYFAKVAQKSREVMYAGLRIPKTKPKRRAKAEAEAESSADNPRKKRKTE